MGTDQVASLEEAGFTSLDREAILARLVRYPTYRVEFETRGMMEYALLRAESAEASDPELMITRQAGLTGFAAVWPDGRRLQAGLNGSLAAALSLVAEVLDEPERPSRR